MIEELVGEFLKSSDGKGVLAQLKQQGLEGPKALEAMNATAEGAMQQLGGGGGGGLAAAASSLLGGSGAGGLPGVAGSLGGSLGGASSGAGIATGATGATGGLAAIAGPIAQFVAQKTGLQPALAHTVVSAALPKLLDVLKGAVPSAGGIAGMFREHVPGFRSQ